MDVYASEREQIDAIKRWWSENGTAVVVGLTVGLGGLFGWQYWKAREATRAEVASIGFQDLVARMLEGESARATGIGEKLLTDHSDSAYAVLAAFALARSSVEAGKLDAARAQLEWIVANAGIPEFVDIARVRLARILLAEGKPDEAASRLEGLDRLKDDAGYHELRGDVLLAQGRRGDARAAYVRALDVATAQRADTALIEMKIDDLAEASPATASGAGTSQ